MMHLKSSTEFTFSLLNRGSAFLMDLLSAASCSMRNAWSVSFYYLRNKGKTEVRAKAGCEQ